MLTIVFVLLVAVLASLVAVLLRVADLERSVEDAHKVLDGLVEFRPATGGPVKAGPPVRVIDIRPSQGRIPEAVLEDFIEMVRRQGAEHGGRA